MKKPKRKECAQILLEAIPPILCTIRNVVHKEKISELSVPQFRTLSFLKRHGSSSLSEVSKHLGPKLSSTSKLINGLVERNLIKRKTSHKDRRYVVITLAKKGEDVMDMVKKATLDYLAKKISSLSDTECLSIIESMTVLKKLFTNDNFRNR
jgi:DNA-binding MarR family transcriptional regulator